MANEFLDASALLALINGEPGADVVRTVTDKHAMMSVVNFAEVISKLVSAGITADQAVDLAYLSGLTLVDLDPEIAIGAGARHGDLRRHGLSLADAICIESAYTAGVGVLTADRQWRNLPGVDILLIR